VGVPTLGPRYDGSRPQTPGGSTPAGGVNPRYRPRPRDEPSRPKPRVGEYPCWQCGKVGHLAEVCLDLHAQLRDRLAIASRWSPLGTSPGSRDTTRAGRRVAVATPLEDSSSSGEESTPLEKGEPQTEPEGGPTTSSESEERNEYPPVLGPPRGYRWTQPGTWIRCQYATFPDLRGSAPGTRPLEGGRRPESGGHPDRVQLPGGQSRLARRGA